MPCFSLRFRVAAAFCARGREVATVLARKAVSCLRLAVDEQWAEALALPSGAWELAPVVREQCCSLLPPTGQAVEALGHFPRNSAALVL
mmetsp:Transcript_42208/g.97727  ORF Transcript_42208/g.97727 Transcript_42208/m.97727 type:complete len:89 (-) Transcript_42208:159-425(-)